MVQFLATNEISTQIGEILEYANQKIVIISPFLKISLYNLSLLGNADERGVRIQLVYGKQYLERNEYDQLFQFKNLELFFCENLHAKCYFNESKLIITSMNLHEYSERYNREMGILIETGSQPDDELYKNAVEESQAIIEISIKKKERLDYKDIEIYGFCIMCRSKMPLDDDLYYVIFLWKID